MFLSPRYCFSGSNGPLSFTFRSAQGAGLNFCSLSCADLLGPKGVEFLRRRIFGLPRAFLVGDVLPDIVDVSLPFLGVLVQESPRFLVNLLVSLGKPRAVFLGALREPEIAPR